MIVGLASPRPATSLEDGLARVERLVAEAAGQGAQIVCFPECYLPGLRGVGIPVLPFGPEELERVVQAVSQMTRTYGTAVILGTERDTDAGRENVAVVIDSDGRVLGWQTKNQLDPSEDPHYVPGDTRQLFEIGGVRFGIAICHEGWRYPETVRWAATRGASIVFHPQMTGTDGADALPAAWGDPAGAYYEKAMMMRSRENTIYFASVNYALRAPDSATSLIHPSGECRAYLPYGEEGVLVQTIDPAQATGLLATRYAPGRYREATTETAR